MKDFNFLNNYLQKFSNLVKPNENLDDNDKSRLENDIKDLKELRESEDMEGIGSMMEKMNETWQEISAKLYEETASEGEQTMNEDSDNQATDVL